jgi:hypothetical protein
MKVIERVYGSPRPRVERMLVEDGDVAGHLTAEGRWESIRAIDAASLSEDLRTTLEALARRGEGHVEWLR